MLLFSPSRHHKHPLRRSTAKEKTLQTEKPVFRHFKKIFNCGAFMAVTQNETLVFWQLINLKPPFLKKKKRGKRNKNI